MIPKASQRGLGQELAAHLLNVHDNEYMELAELRGAIADDLHGAFAEWEFQAKALTRCQNYLYSLSISPNQVQGKLSRAQYAEYINRVEERLGLTSQPRAVIFHIKDGREHAHVVWSRVDATNEKAVQMSFDHQKLMMVTREFARDHGLQLPAGYSREAGAQKAPKITLFDRAQERRTGISKHEHAAQVTALWNASDNAKSFVAALADKGYLLATGKRPYVVVDFYGGQYALPRLLNARQKDVENFLKTHYPPEELPTVDEAKTLIGEYRKSIEAHLQHEHRAAEFERQRRQHQMRRDACEKEHARLKKNQRKEMAEMRHSHHAQRADLRVKYLASKKAIQQQRERLKPKGLAAFLGRVTGVDLVRKKIHHYHYKKRLLAYRENRDELRLHQRTERDGLVRLHEMQGLVMRRKLDNLKQDERKERKSLEDFLLKETRSQARGKTNQMPSLAMGLKPRGRRAVPHKAMTRHYKPETAKEVSASALTGTFEAAAVRAPEMDTEPLKETFARAAEEGKGEQDGNGSSEGAKKPQRQRKPRRQRRAERRKEEQEERQEGRKRRHNNDLDRGR